jgi:membrane protein
VRRFRERAREWGEGRGRWLLAIAKKTGAAWSEDNVPRLSAALAYYSVFSIAPLLVIAIGVAGWALGPDAVTGKLDPQLRSVMGAEAAKAVQSLVQSASKPGDSAWAAVIGFGTMLLGASGVFGQLKDALNTIWGVREKASSGVVGFLQERLLSFGMVLAIGFLLLTSLVMTTVLALLSKYVGHVLPVSEGLIGTFGFLLSAGMVTCLFALIFKVLPDVNVQWRHVWTGAAFTAVLFEIGKFLLGWYLGRESVASPFGAAGSLILVLLWVYYTSVIVLTGAEFTQQYARASGSRVRAEPNATAATPEMRAEEGMAPVSAETAPLLKTASPAPAPARVLVIRPKHSPPSAPRKPAFLIAIGSGFAIGLIVRLCELRAGARRAWTSGK